MVSSPFYSSNTCPGKYMGGTEIDRKRAREIFSLPNRRWRNERISSREGFLPLTSREKSSAYRTPPTPSQNILPSSFLVHMFYFVLSSLSQFRVVYESVGDFKFVTLKYSVANLLRFVFHSNSLSYFSYIGFIEVYI